jgi:hypothetical protein
MAESRYESRVCSFDDSHVNVSLSMFAQDTRDVPSVVVES